MWGWVFFFLLLEELPTDSESLETWMLIVFHLLWGICSRTTVFPPLLQYCNSWSSVRLISSQIRTNRRKLCLPAVVGTLCHKTEQEPLVGWLQKEGRESG